MFLAITAKLCERQGQVQPTKRRGTDAPLPCKHGRPIWG
jgi:hypothetical protein